MPNWLQLEKSLDEPVFRSSFGNNLTIVDIITGMMENWYTDNLLHVILCHLAQNNKAIVTYPSFIQQLFRGERKSGPKEKFNEDIRYVVIPRNIEELPRIYE